MTFLNRTGIAFMSSNFEMNDVESIVKLIDHATDPSREMSLPDRRRLLAQQLADLIAADVWIWSTTIMNHAVPGDMMTTCVQEAGWQSNEERSRVFAVLTSPTFGARALADVYRAMVEGRGAIYTKGEIFPKDAEAELTAIWEATGFQSFLLATHPLDGNVSSNIGFHRRRGKPPFALREKLILQTVFGNVRWLHHYGINEAARETTLRLSPRERQTLVYLLSGQSHKEIAEIMGISQHTVNDYVKHLHIHYEVNSRAELQALFFLGGKQENDDRRA